MRLTVDKRKRTIYGFFTVFYAEKDGHAVLKGERSWKKINGFMIQVFSCRIQFLFRRIYAN
jgi:hypothetical protein